MKEYALKPKTGHGHFTKKFEYNYDFQNHTAIVSCKNPKGTSFRMLDPWALCYKEWIESQNEMVSNIKLILGPDCTHKLPEIESFKRRISFLQLNNPPIVFEIEVNGKSEPLYSLNDLLNRPAHEIIHKEVNIRTAGDKPGRLEKDFQAFLFGGTILSDTQGLSTNYADIYRRLGVLGDDFYNLKESYKVLREYPTGVFHSKIVKSNRILPTYFIDIVTFNKRKELSIIELKLNYPKIESISQILDYALFSVTYKNQLSKILKDNFCPDKFEEKPIACYLVNNQFHPGFDSIIKYYNSDPKKFGFKLFKIDLGRTTLI